MHGAMYCKILEPPSLSQNTADRLWMVFQHGEEPQQTTKTTKQLKKKDIEVVEKTSQSPALSPIDNLWMELKLQVAKQKPRNLKDLESCCRGPEFLLRRVETRHVCLGIKYLFHANQFRIFK